MESTKRRKLGNKQYEFKTIEHARDLQKEVFSDHEEAIKVRA